MRAEAWKSSSETAFHGEWTALARGSCTIALAAKDAELVEWKRRAGKYVAGCEQCAEERDQRLRNQAVSLNRGCGKMTDQKYMRPGLDFAVGKAVEEAGEFQAAIGKTLRWGWDSSNPELPPAEQETNAQWVRREMKDLRNALDNLEHEMDEWLKRPALRGERGLK